MEDAAAKLAADPHRKHVHVWSASTLQAMLAEARRLLPYKFHVVELYRQGEAATGKVTLPPPLMGREFHLFCSPHNAGANERAEELKAADVWVTKGKKA